MKKILFVLIALCLFSCNRSNQNFDLLIDNDTTKTTDFNKETEQETEQFQNVDTVIVRNKVIYIGMLADDLFKVINHKKIFNEQELIGKEESTDPNKTGSLIVTNHYKTEDKFIDIILFRPTEPGPYKIKEIKTKYFEKNEVDENPKELKFKRVKEIDVAGFILKIGQDAYIPQGKLESYFIKNEGDVLSTHDSYYLVDGKTILITYGPSSDGPYIVKEIKVSE